ncbi:hypothetical protein TMU01_18440 [Tenuibacillus multivorans]|uniref:Uncharacterized protein n=1 Tax=Tenuibacillus multivorans TaxID=237069 RepID=A0A1H0AYN4_9BACI|nr:hypothetical protein [Tenuibacillus multivorans]GEL77609.1 hypothetical protein TMU01_18440 [Tenuibacillus multivorans]SDN38552.1 hypothetical protein SAMN05216498_2139 [Tenuibacillus multivorans]
MNINNLRQDLSIKGKNGIAFLLSATIIWTIFTIIFSLPNNIETKNIFMLITTGIMFPLALLFSKLIKADWKIDQNPLSNLGLVINLAQFIYFPIAFWAFVKHPSEMVMFFAVITAAHLFPYGWFYNAKAYYVMAPIAAILVAIIGSTVESLWIIPLMMIGALLILNLLLFVDYRKKSKTTDEVVMKAQG